MTRARHRGRAAARLRSAMALLLLLAPASAAAEPAASAEDARVRSESQKLAANQERALRDDDKRLAEITARETGIDEARRAQKITADRALAASAALSGAGLPPGVASKGETWGQTLARMADVADRDAGTLQTLYRAQTEYVDDATRDWADGPERKQLQESGAQLQRNMEAARASMIVTTETAETMTARLPQAQLLDKVARIETAAKEAGERLSARWERERAAREREREQREREAGERAREQRR
ncbi:MAG TPA: hypothetical protein VIA61_06415 [Methylomirabilota bacterium]